MFFVAWNSSIQQDLYVEFHEQFAVRDGAELVDADERVARIGLVEDLAPRPSIAVDVVGQIDHVRHDFADVVVPFPAAASATPGSRMPFAPAM